LSVISFLSGLYETGRTYETEGVEVGCVSVLCMCLRPTSFRLKLRTVEPRVTRLGTWDDLTAARPAGSKWNQPPTNCQVKWYVQGVSKFPGQLWRAITSTKVDQFSQFFHY